MKYYHYIALLIISSFLFFACQKEKEEDENIIEKTGFLNVKFTPVINGVTFSLNQAETGFLDYRYKIETFKMFLSNIIADGSDCSQTLSEIELFDFETNENNFTSEILTQDYNGLQFDLGVQPEDNVDQDPSLHATDHPLSYANAVVSGMHWGWNTGYMFFKVDGKADTNLIENVSPDYPFFFHIGNDDLLSTIELDNRSFTISENDTTHLEILIDMQSIFYNENDSIDIISNPGTHTNDGYELAERFTATFSKAFE